MRNIFNLLLAFIFICAPLALLTNCSKKGCTDPEAYNYDNEAKKGDGTCKYLKAQIEIIKIQQDSSSGFYLGTKIDYSIENIGNLDIDYVEIWFKVTTTDGYSFIHWTNCCLSQTILIGEKVNDCTYVDTDGKQHSSVTIDDYELTNN